MNRRSIVASWALLVLAAGCGSDDDDGARPTATVALATATATRPDASATAMLATATPTGTGTTAPSATGRPPTATAQPPTPTSTPAPTGTATASATPTQTATPAPPRITFFGVARADDLVQTPAAVDAAGRPIYERVQGQGMTLVLEAARGTLPLADLAYDPFGGLPGAQFIVSRPLGDGSAAVCDFDPPVIGGIPATDPLAFSDAPAVVDAINDLGCRVNDGTGVPRVRFESSAACTRDARFEFSFIADDSHGQFCLPIARAWAFPPGDTIVAARVQDIRGNHSAPSEIVIRVLPDVPFECESGLGQRDFTPARPGSGLFSSAEPGDASRDPWSTAAIRICAGPDLGGGVHALALREDAVLGIPLADGTTLCAKLFARGSDGSIDCDGGSAHGVRASQDAGVFTRVELETGLGDDGGAGAASLLVPIGLEQLAGTRPEACATEPSYTFRVTAALTTALGTAEVTDPEGGPPIATLSRGGANFDCAAWRAEGAGTLVLPFPVLGTAAGPLAVVVELDD